MYCPHCGREINMQADICLGCGRSVKKIKKSAQNDSKSVGWWWLGFFFPLIGFVLWLVWTGDTPIRAKRVGWGALIGTIVSVAVTILFCVLIFVFSVMIGINIADSLYYI